MGAHHAFYSNNHFHNCFLLGFFHRFFLVLKITKPQGVGHHKHAAETHSGSPQHGGQLNAQGQIQHACRNGNAQGIIEECPEQILADIADGGPAQGDGAAYGAKGTAHQHDIRGIHGDVRTGTDGHAHVRRDQRRGIVDAVAHHEHVPALLAKILHRPGLIRGQHVGNDFGNACLLGDDLGGHGVVACEHDHFQTPGLQTPDGFGRILFQHIRRRNGTQIALLFAGEIQGRFPLPRKFREPRDGKAQAFHQAAVAAAAARALHGSGHAPSGKGLKIRHIGNRTAAIFRNNCPGEGMLRRTFQGCGKAQQFL